MCFERFVASIWHGHLLICLYRVVVTVFVGQFLYSEMWCVPLYTAAWIVSIARCGCNVLREQLPNCVPRSRRELRRILGPEGALD